ncbi:beta-ketoacyl-[acyl-carrier-protein] synthase II [Streptomyces ruber]|uniref:Beta-ketoacyl-[acyl-carrier-protein] synthase II n=2 Tax=Streptomyces TaxID=1883 RepID=A0A918BM71_9ACTN|nr:beta-ketoacyl synthase N-terminal-like domain-containing protein [Streptomyces ruber]GGQ75844.1 beta-ketoacyl-[acyl-carrier-protein] synthase II [Streptomyces ruber]
MARVTGLSVLTAYGRGPEALWDGLLSAAPAATPVTRFDTARHRAHAACTVPGDPDLFTELESLVGEACDQAGLSSARRARTPLVLAVHAGRDTAARAGRLSAACGLREVLTVHTGACAASATAVAEAAHLISVRTEERIVVAGGSFVDASMFAAFDSAGVLSAEGVARPFSAGRDGPVLGDGAAAVVLERDGSARPWAHVAGWGNASEAHHVCRPHAEGVGPAAAVAAALHRAGIGPDRIGYVNAHATATPAFDASEAAALVRALAPYGGRVPVSSTKALHGHCLEASGLVELAVCALAFHHGELPVNAGYLGPDGDCPLNLVLEHGQPPPADHALSLNTGFGGVSAVLLLAGP